MAEEIVYTPFFKSVREMAAEMDPAEGYQFMMAIMDYFFDDKEPELSGAAKIAFIGTRPNLDKHKQMRKRNLANRKGAPKRDEPVTTDAPDSDEACTTHAPDGDETRTNDAPDDDEACATDAPKLLMEKEKEREREKEKDKEKAKETHTKGAVAPGVSQKSQRFSPPSLSDVTEYAIERGDPPDQAEAFIDHYTSNGWKVGGRSAMKDWRASWRNWMRRRNDGDFSPSKKPPDENKALRSWDDVPVTRVDDDWLEGYDLGN